MTLLDALAVSCGPDRPLPTMDELRQPTGMRLWPEGRWAFVTNGNWDRTEQGGAVIVLDLAGLARALAEGPGDGAPTRAAPCRIAGDRLSCSAAHMVVSEAGVAVGSAVGNIVLDRPTGDGGPTRLLTVQRAPSEIVWFDVSIDDDGPALDCGVDFDGACDEVHRIRSALERPEIDLPDDPSRVVLDDQGYRFAYVPHLLGGAISLLALDGEIGPELVDVVGEFYRTDPFEGTEYAGGFGVASRPCDPASAPESSRECTRPVLYGSQRFDPSVRRFAVAPGLDVVVPGDESSLGVVNPEVVESTPFMGDLAFEDPVAGTSLLVVQTSPGALLQVDTSIDEDGEPRDLVRASLPLCEQPNVVAVYRPGGGDALALVTCFGEGLLAAVELAGFRLLATVTLGDGANEITIDAQSQRAYVVNTREDSISVVSLDRSDPAFLTEVARIE